MRTFSQPLTVYVGLGFPARITRLIGVRRILDEWPVSLRGAAYEHASDACREALADPARLADAHRAFVDFAAAAGILADEPMHIAAERVANEWFGAR
jgi:hypothetical protein